MICFVLAQGKIVLIRIPLDYEGQNAVCVHEHVTDCSLRQRGSTGTDIIQDAEAWLVVVFVLVDADVDLDGTNSFRMVQLTNYKQKKFNQLNLTA
jgi:hypothetical protein